jgi:Cu+-exporting ATPase
MHSHPTKTPTASPAVNSTPNPTDLVYMGLPHERVLRPRLWVALTLSLPVLVLAMGEMVPGLRELLPMARVSGWLQFALTTPVFFWCGWFFIRRWWKSIRERDTNMFTLTVTGTGAAYFYSTAALLFPKMLATATTHGAAHGLPFYFEATAVITTIVLLDRILEQYAPPSSRSRPPVDQRLPQVVLVWSR